MAGCPSVRVHAKDEMKTFGSMRQIAFQKSAPLKRGVSVAIVRAPARLSMYIHSTDERCRQSTREDGRGVDVRAPREKLARLAADRHQSTASARPQTSTVRRGARTVRFGRRPLCGARACTRSGFDDT